MNKDIFQNLNPEQLAAVKTTEGPLLVIAGPGTGKTQLLSSRAANILMSTDTQASNILCLTFTNKAAINMRDRLMQITNGKARDVVVKTFHSFSSEIMNTYPDYFWSGAKLSTAPDAVQLDIITSILSDLPLDNPLALKFAGAYTLIPDVQKGLKLAKDAGLTPEKLKSLIEINLAYIDSIEDQLSSITEKRLSKNNLDELLGKVQELPDQKIDDLIEPLVSLSSIMKEGLETAITNDKEIGKTTKTGEWKKHWVQNVDGKRAMHKERAKNIWWLALADVYKKYRKELHQRKYYDYSDMLVEVLQQIEKNPNLRADIQEQFLYIMIDEFQDTNAAQLRLAHLIADNPSLDNPNFMAVGDDDQSIFKFNGAELNNMLSFKRSYPTCKQIVLTKNYRSNQQILDTAEKVILNATDRLVNIDRTINKKLTASNPSIKNGTIKHTVYRSQEDQINLISKSIAKSYSSEKSIAVIARSHSSLRQIASILNSLDVPLHYEQQRNILDHEIIKQAILLSQIAISIKSGDRSMASLYISQTLRHKMWSIDNKTLWELAILNRNNGSWLDALLESEEEKLVSIGNLFLELARISTTENLAVSIEHIIGLRKLNELESPLKNYFSNLTNITNDYLHGLSAIHLLRDMATEFCKNSQPTLEDFVNFIELEINTDTVINDESPFVTGDNAVNLLTVHKAKGLEFDEVYIIDCIENNWQPRKGGRKPPSNLPLQPPGDTLDDYARMMFVAVTRAKSSLFVSSYSFDERGKEVLVSPLISNAVTPELNDQEFSAIESLEQSLSWPRLSVQNESKLLAPILEGYSLNVTHLINFLDLSNGGPQTFLERNLLRIPSAKTSSLAHGTAMHEALDFAQKSVNQDNFNLENIINRYKITLESELLTAVETERYLNYGKQQIEKLFEDGLLQLAPGAISERTLTDIRLGEARIAGKLDLIDNQEDKITVSDYKTGAPLNSFETQDQQKQIKAWRHKLQLIYYVILINNSGLFNAGKKDVAGQMIYLDATKHSDMYKPYVPSQEEIARTEKIIKAAWAKIIKVDLPDTSSYKPDYSGIIKFEEDLINGDI